MEVSLNGNIHKCHCPSTGRIGSITFDKIPCLLSSPDSSSKRKTDFTVEAISLDSVSARKKKWIGINQNRVNRYVEFFIKNKMMSNMVNNGEQVKRERTLGDSRIDFGINGVDFIEVKTPLGSIPCEDHPNFKPVKSSPSHLSDRLLRHYQALVDNLKEGSKAVVLLCFMYDAKPFDPPPRDSIKDPAMKKRVDQVVNHIRNATEKGVENWQVNLEIDDEGVSMTDYFQLDLFSK